MAPGSRDLSRALSQGSAPSWLAVPWVGRAAGSGPSGGGWLAFPLLELIIPRPAALKPEGWQGGTLPAEGRGLVHPCPPPRETSLLHGEPDPRGWQAGSCHGSSQGARKAVGRPTGEMLAECWGLLLVMGEPVGPPEGPDPASAAQALSALKAFVVPRAALRPPKVVLGIVGCGRPALSKGQHS